MIPALAQRAGRIQPSLFSLEHMTEEAISFLLQHEPPEGYFVGFSGGKDSIVTEHLCRMAGVKFAAGYNVTTIDPPEVVRFIRRHYPQVEFLRPEMTFLQGVIKNGPPKIKERWCCRLLKEEPGKKHYLAKYTVLGIRAEESPSRAARGRISQQGKRKPRYEYHPIYHWREWHIWAFIDTHNLPYPRLYDEGFGRIGCIVCPFIMHANGKKLALSRERWPKMFAAFERAAEKWHDTRTPGEGYENETFEEYIAAYYRGFE